MRMSKGDVRCLTAMGVGGIDLRNDVSKGSKTENKSKRTKNKLKSSRISKEVKVHNDDNLPCPFVSSVGTNDLMPLATASCCSFMKLFCLSARSRRRRRPGVTPAPSRPPKHD